MAVKASAVPSFTVLLPMAASTGEALPVIGCGTWQTFDPRNSVSGDDVSTWTAGLNYYVRGDNLKLLLDYLRTDLGANSPASKQNKILLRFQAMF